MWRSRWSGELRISGPSSARCVASSDSTASTRVGPQSRGGCADTDDEPQSDTGGSATAEDSERDSSKTSQRPHTNRWRGNLCRRTWTCHIRTRCTRTARAWTRCNGTRCTKIGLTRPRGKIVSIEPVSTWTNRQYSAADSGDVRTSNGVRSRSDSDGRRSNPSHHSGSSDDLPYGNSRHGELPACLGSKHSDSPGSANHISNTDHVDEPASVR